MGSNIAGNLIKTWKLLRRITNSGAKWAVKEGAPTLPEEAVSLTESLESTQNAASIGELVGPAAGGTAAGLSWIYIAAAIGVLVAVGLGVYFAYKLPRPSDSGSGIVSAKQAQQNRDLQQRIRAAQDLINHPGADPEAFRAAQDFLKSLPQQDVARLPAHPERPEFSVEAGNTTVKGIGGGSDAVSQMLEANWWLAPYSSTDGDSPLRFQRISPKEHRIVAVVIPDVGDSPPVDISQFWSLLVQEGSTYNAQFRIPSECAEIQLGPPYQVGDEAKLPYAKGGLMRLSPSSATLSIEFRDGRLIATVTKMIACDRMGDSHADAKYILTPVASPPGFGTTAFPIAHFNPSPKIIPTEDNTFCPCSNRTFCDAEDYVNGKPRAQMSVASVRRSCKWWRESVSAAESESCDEVRNIPAYYKRCEAERAESIRECRARADYFCALLAHCSK